MKKSRIFSLLLVGLLLAAFPLQGAAEDFVFTPDPGVIDMTKTRPRSEIVIRDPFVLVYGQKYFLYGTGISQGEGYGCYVSEDMENWAGPVNIFTATPEFPGVWEFWAPECHYYNGMFYLFGTYFSRDTQHRGVSIFRSDNPLGPFEEITDGHITPPDWDSIDGTLYIDPDGQPWMVFVHEWTSMPDHIGDFSIAKLSADFTHFISKPTQLFRASEIPGRLNGNIVTDGCWLVRSRKGELLMLWSGYGKNDEYCVVTAKSTSGSIEGPWQQFPHPLYERRGSFEFDGGHGMIFTALDGKQYLSIHSPNRAEVGAPRPLFLEITEKDGRFVLKQELDETLSFKQTVTKFFSFMLDGLIAILRGIAGIFTK